MFVKRLQNIIKFISLIVLVLSINSIIYAETQTSKSMVTFDSTNSTIITVDSTFATNLIRPITHEFGVRPLSLMLGTDGNTYQSSFNLGLSIVYNFNFLNIAIGTRVVNLISLYTAIGINFSAGTLTPNFSILIDGGISLFDKTLNIGFGVLIFSTEFSKWDAVCGLVISSRSFTLLGGEK